LKKRTAREHQLGLLNVPYYRMHLRPLRHSDQHNLLLDLDTSGETVFYIAPEFHLPEELNDFYLDKMVVENSAAFRPSEIGTLPDEEAHYLAFERGSTFAFRCSSDPMEIPKQSLKDGLLPLLMSADVQTRALGADGIGAIMSRMLDVLGRAEARYELMEKRVDLDGVRRITSHRSPAEALGYVARTFFDAELVILPSDH
jgi:hypothetical protein